MKNSFGKSIIPPNEQSRLEALHSYQIVNTLREGFFDNLAHIVAKCFDTPVALISLVDKEQVYFKANVGMEGTDFTDRGISLCSLAVLDPHPTIFEDALKEPCLLTNPLVAGDFGLRFYAGAPITTPDGFLIGTVCIVDKEPRTFSPSDQELLVRFADSVMNGIIERREALDKGQSFH